MKNIFLIGFLMIFLVGCATAREQTRTLQGAAIGAGVGAIVKGETGAWIGAAIGGALGSMLGTAEEDVSRATRAASREPKVIDLGNGKKAVIVYGRTGGVLTGSQNRVSPYTYGRSSYDYGYGAPDCSMFPTPNEQAECERGKRYTEDKLRRERERRAYEYGQYGY